MYRTDFGLWEKARVGCFEKTDSKHVYYQGQNRSPAQVGCMRQVFRAGALGRPRGMGCGGRWEGGSGWGIHVNPWLIHVNVWQKPLQYCKVISLQLIKINGRKNLEIELPYDPAISLLGIHTQETRIERDTCTPMFIAALFTIARTWKQPRCPSADEWIRKLWYIYTMEYYSAIEKNAFESVLMRWMKLEPTIQSEVSQKEKHQYSILAHIYGI